MAVAILTDRVRVVTGGVDTHKDVHVAAMVDELGAHLGTRSFPTTRTGYQQMADWMAAFGAIGVVGVEGSGSWGAGLTRYLSAAGIKVVEIHRPDRQTRHRDGKSDDIDALAAARSAVAGLDAGTPKSGDGPIEMIRMLCLARRSAMKTRTITINQIRSIIDTAPTEICDRYRYHTPTRSLIDTLARSRRKTLTCPHSAATYTLKTLARRWLFVDKQISDLDKQIETLINTHAPSLSAVYGVGTHTAATLLICAGDNPHRIVTEAKFAALCGVAPQPTGSGKTSNRHRINKAGNRQANNALWRIAMTRLSHDPRTRTYAARRTTEGLSKQDIIRCLKRYIAREIYPTIINDLTNHTTN